MKRSRSSLSVAVVVGLAAILVALAALQVRWINEVSRAEHERLQARLQTAIARFQQDFEEDLLDVCWAFAGDVPSPKLFADRYQYWQDTSPHPGLVSGVFVWDAQRSRGSHLLALSPVTGVFEPAPWPPELIQLKGDIESQAAPSLSVARAARLANQWTLDESAPALVHFFIDSSRAQTPRVSGALIAELSLPTIQGVILPRLVSRFFGGPQASTYLIWIVAGTHSSRVLYQSTQRLPDGKVSDAAVALLPIPTLSRDSVSRQNGALSGTGLSRRQARAISALAGARHAPPVIVPAPGEASWRLIARHRAGSLEEAVLGLRRRDMTLSLGVLALLALSMAMIVISAQRAKRLARLQMDLVAGVSHELRTPLAVIRSAAENLADGVVSDSTQVQEYGALIREQDRKLSEMVSHVLAFAAESSRHRKYDVRPLDVASVVQSALLAARPVLKSSAATVEKRLDPGLPMVRADASALARCIENLISNAARYGGRNPWIGVRARSALAPRGREVQIQIEDHGSGIHPDDLPYIFEPFYRGKGTQNLPGTGLGLSLAREIAEALGGRLTVQSELGRGTCFTLHLAPLADPVPQSQPQEP